jgi:hypothetical protein
VEKIPFLVSSSANCGLYSLGGSNEKIWGNYPACSRCPINVQSSRYHPHSGSRAQIWLYLGIEHRVESIHIDVFTHQLQKETREGHEVGRVRREGPPGLQWPTLGRTAAERMWEWPYWEQVGWCSLGSSLVLRTGF